MGNSSRHARRYADGFRLSRIDRWRLHAHTPLFRIMWEANYAHGRRRTAAQAVARYSRHWVIAPKARGAGWPVRVPIRFDPTDMASFTEVFYSGAYPRVLASATTYVDAGANTGMTACFFATQYRLRRMLLIEANPLLHTRLCSNTASIPTDVRIESAAVAPQAGNVAFAISTNHRHSRIAREGSTTVVRGTTLRHLFEKHGFEHVDILKLDIEGAEHQVLRADPEVLSIVQCLLVELHGAREDRESTAQVIATQGFDVAHDRQDAVDMLVALRAD